MIAYNPKDVLISLHVPKSGGISLGLVLKRWFGAGFHWHHKDHVNDAPPRTVKFRMLFKRFLPLAVHGHFDKQADGSGAFDLYPGARQFITLVRDPLELQLSYYFYSKHLVNAGQAYWNGRKIENTGELGLGADVDEHLESAQRRFLDFFPWALTPENFQEIIEANFIHIGVTDELQRSVDIFAEKLGKKTVVISRENASPRDETPSESSIRKFKESHKLEYEIYRHAVGLNR